MYGWDTPDLYIRSLWWRYTRFCNYMIHYSTNHVNTHSIDSPRRTHSRRLVVELYPHQVLAADYPIQLLFKPSHSRIISTSCCGKLTLRVSQQFKEFSYTITDTRDYIINPSKVHSIMLPHRLFIPWFLLSPVSSAYIIVFLFKLRRRALLPGLYLFTRYALQWATAFRNLCFTSVLSTWEFHRFCPIIQCAFPHKATSITY